MPGFSTAVVPEAGLVEVMTLLSMHGETRETGGRQRTGATLYQCRRPFGDRHNANHRQSAQFAAMFCRRAGHYDRGHTDVAGP